MRLQMAYAGGQYRGCLCSIASTRIRHTGLQTFSLTKEPAIACCATHYSLFEDERTRAVRDRLAGVPPRPVRHATDLGCGKGNSTEVLRQHHPDALVVALDSDPDMIDKAGQRRRLCVPQVRCETAEIAG